MKIKRVLFGVAGLASVAALASCGGGQQDFTKLDGVAGTYKTTVWVSETKTEGGDSVVKLTQEQIAKFNEINGMGITIDATVRGVGEGDAATQMLTDVETGADIYCFAQDQFARLVSGGALASLGKGAMASVKERNDASAVKAATLGSENMMYAYPLTADNGYFMYYDKSVITDASHLTSLEALIKDCEDKNKLFAFEVQGSAWYTASFFFAQGSDGKPLCKSDWVVNEQGKFTGVDDTFNSDNGFIAIKGLEKLVKSKSFLDSSSATAFGAPTADDERTLNAGVVVSGTWDVKTAKSKLGNNLGVAELPSFKVNDKSYHLGSFSGFKLMGVKPQSDVKRAAVFQQLALYLTGKDCSVQRYERFGWGPANLAAQENDAVKVDPTLQVLGKQNKYAVLQGQIHGSWWDIAKAIGTGAKNAKDDTELRKVLSDYKGLIDALFQMSEDEKNAFTLIGKFDGHNWDADVAMTKTEEGGNQIWTSAGINFAASDEFKVRQGKSWDKAFPAQNFVIETAGTYRVKLTYNPTTDEGLVELIPAN